MGGFNDNFNDLLIKRFGFSYTEAGQLIMIPFGGMAIYSVIIGKLLSDYPAYRRITTLVTFSWNFIAMLALYYLPNSHSP